MRFVFRDCRQKVKIKPRNAFNRVRTGKFYKFFYGWHRTPAMGGDALLDGIAGKPLSERQK